MGPVMSARTIVATFATILVAATIARAQLRPNPADVMPASIPLYVDVTDVAAAIAGVRALPFLDVIPKTPRAQLDRALDILDAAKARRVGIGLIPGGLTGKPHVLLAVATDDPTAVESAIVKLTGARSAPASTRLGAFLLLSDDPDSLSEAVETSDDPKHALSSRLPRTESPALIRFHANVEKLAPIRFGIGHPKDIGAALFAAHVLGVLSTAPTVDGTLDLSPSLDVRLDAPCQELPATKAFAAPDASTLPALAPPTGCAIHLGLARNLSAFWSQRDKLIGDKGKTGLAEFQNNAAILLGGLQVEELFAGLGTGFDAYVARLPDDAAPTAHRFPTAALVAEVKNPRLKTEILLGFQTTMGIVNADRAQKGEPRFLQETARHRDVLIVSASYLADALPEPTDDRLQLAPSMAITGDRLILGTHPSIVRALVDQALDGHTTPRLRGDSLDVRGREASTLLRDAAAFIASRQILEEGKTSDEADAVAKTLGDVAARISTISARFNVEKALATLMLNLAPARPATAPESRR